jgi:hypothetical protein
MTVTILLAGLTGTAIGFLVGLALDYWLSGIFFNRWYRKELEKYHDSDDRTRR